VTSQNDKKHNVKNILYIINYSLPAKEPLFLCLLDHRLTNYVL